jgi:hypothetical protein
MQERRNCTAKKFDMLTTTWSVDVNLNGADSMIEAGG